jgi:drug/metabolite transporter (DMT)-like permease
MGLRRSGLDPTPVHDNVTPRMRGLVWMTAANSLFAVMSITARLASRSAHWSTLAAARAGIGALVALTFALARHAPLRTRARGLSWARSLLGTVSMLTTFYAVGSPDLALGDAATLFATSPLFIAALSPWLLGEPTDRSLWAILLVAFAGAAIVAGPHLSFGSLPAASALTASLFSALAMMFLRKMRAGSSASAPESTEAIALHFGLVAFTVFLGINLVYFRMPAPIDLAYLAIAGLSGGVAQLAMTRAYALTEAARLGALGYVGTVLSLLGAFVFLDERPTILQVLGSLLVIGAGTVLAWLSAQGLPSPRPTRAKIPA